MKRIALFLLTLTALISSSFAVAGHVITADLVRINGTRPFYLFSLVTPNSVRIGDTGIIVAGSNRTDFFPRQSGFNASLDASNLIRYNDSIVVDIWLKKIGSANSILAAIIQYEVASGIYLTAGAAEACTVSTSTAGGARFTFARQVPIGTRFRVRLIPATDSAGVQRVEISDKPAPYAVTQ